MLTNAYIYTYIRNENCTDTVLPNNNIFTICAFLVNRMVGSVDIPQKQQHKSTLALIDINVYDCSMYIIYTHMNAFFDKHFQIVYCGGGESNSVIVIYFLASVRSAMIQLNRYV